MSHHQKDAARCSGRLVVRLAVVSLVFCSMMAGCTWVRSLVGKSPEKAHKLASLAREAEEAGDVRQAVAFFEDALEESPSDPRLHREMARLLLSLDQRQQALDHLVEAVEHNPDDVEANVDLAELYIETYQAQLAADHLDAALQNDPKHTTALLLRAKLAEYLGDSELAIETYHRVLSTDPNHVEARVRIAWLQLERHQPHLSAPLLRSVCNSSRAAPEEVAEARWTLGIAYGQEQRWPDAVRVLNDAAERRAEMSADDWYRVAYARSQVGDWQGAEQDLHRALEINPHHENAQAMRELFHQQDQSPGTPILRIGHTVKPLPVPDFW